MVVTLRVPKYIGHVKTVTSISLQNSSLFLDSANSFCLPCFLCYLIQIRTTLGVPLHLWEQIKSLWAKSAEWRARNDSLIVVCQKLSPWERCISKCVVVMDKSSFVRHRSQPFLITLLTVWTYFECTKLCEHCYDI